ncbi:MAG: hypothetical protein ACK4PG_08620 [Acetobacteraceae bacterium]
MTRDFTLSEARDAALRDLLGAVAVACCHLAALRSDATLGDAMADDAAEWLEAKLSIAAEHVRALHDGHAPRWLTMADADTIRAGLAIAAEAKPEG